MMTESERPPWKDMTTKQRWFFCYLIAKDIFLVVKSLAFLIKSAHVSRLYKNTYKTWV